MFSKYENIPLSASLQNGILFPGLNILYSGSSISEMFTTRDSSDVFFYPWKNTKLHPCVPNWNRRTFERCDYIADSIQNDDPLSLHGIMSVSMQPGHALLIE